MQFAVRVVSFAMRFLGCVLRIGVDPDRVSRGDGRGSVGRRRGGRWGAVHVVRDVHGGAPESLHVVKPSVSVPERSNVFNRETRRTTQSSRTEPRVV